MHSRLVHRAGRHDEPWIERTVYLRVEPGTAHEHAGAERQSNSTEDQVVRRNTTSGNGGFTRIRPAG
jgi:hypothetical protein